MNPTMKMFGVPAMAVVLTLPAAAGAAVGVADVPAAAVLAADAAVLEGDVVIEAGKTAEVTVPSGNIMTGIRTVSGPKADGKTQPGGTLVKRGAGELALKAPSDKGVLLDRVTLEYAEGSVSMKGVRNREQVRLSGAVVRWLGAGETQIGHQGYCHTYFENGTEINVADPKGVLKHLAWAETPKTTLVKTGPGAVMLCPHEDFRCEIREGTFLIEGDNKPEATLTVGAGGALAYGDTENCNAATVFEDGGSVAVRNGMVLNLKGRVTAKGCIGVQGLPETPVAGTAVLKSSNRDLSFRLPETYAGCDVFYSEGVYRVQPAMAAEQTFVEDGHWLPEGCYTDLTLNLNGHTVTLDGSLTARRLTVKGGGTLIAAAGTSFSIGTFLVGGDGVLTLPSATVASLPHLQIAAGATVRTVLDSAITFSGLISGPVADDGTVQPGGVFRKEGAGKLTFSGKAGRPCDLDHVTIEIAEGQLRTAYGNREFTVNATTFSFVEKANGTWDYSVGSGHKIVSRDVMTVHVGTGVTVRCNSWFGGAGLNKTGPGTFDFALNDGYRATVSEGVWQMTGGGDSRASARVTVKSGAVVTRRKGAGNFCSAVHFEKGAAIRCDAETPLKLFGEVTFDAPIRVEGLPDRPAEIQPLLYTDKNTLEFELPAAWGRVSSVFVRDHYDLLLIRDTVDLGTLKADTELNFDGMPRFKNLKADLGGHRVTVYGNAQYIGMELSGSGTVELAPDSSLQIAEKLTLAEGARIVMPIGAVFGLQTKQDEGYCRSNPPAVQTPAVELGKDAVLDVASEGGAWYFGTGRISGPVGADGTVSAGGTLRKSGDGLLCLYNTPNGLLDHATLDLAGGNLGTYKNKTVVTYRDSVIRVTGAPEHPVTSWWHTWSNHQQIEGSLTVDVAEGIRMNSDCWIRGSLIKDGAGEFSLCTDDTLQLDVRKGTWVIDSDSRSGAQVLVRTGAEVARGNGRCNGSVTLEEGAVIRCSETPVEFAGPVTAQGPLAVSALPEQPAGRYILKCTNPNLTFALDPALTEAGFFARYDGIGYVLAQRTDDITLNLTADGELEGKNLTCERVAVSLGGHTLTVRNGTLNTDLLTVSGSGTVVFENGAVRARRVVFDTPDARLNVAPGLILSQRKDIASPSVEIAEGTDVTFGIATEHFSGSRISGPVGEDGTVARGGRLIKQGEGWLNLLANPLGVLDSVTLDIAEGNLATYYRNGNVVLRNAAVRWTGTGGRRWAYSTGKSIHSEGTVTLWTDKGITVDAQSQQTCAADGKVVKAGPGNLIFCPRAGNGSDRFNLFVEEGCYFMNPDHTSAVRATVGPKGSVASDGSYFKGPMTLQPGASGYLRPHSNGRDLMVPGCDGPLTAEGPIGILGLPEDPAQAKPDQALFHASDPTLEFTLPDAYIRAGYGVRFDGRDYCLAKNVSDIVRDVTAGDDILEITEPNAVSGRLKINFGTAGHTLTVKGSLYANRIVISGTGRLVLAPDAALSAACIDITAPGTVSLPASLVFSETAGVRTPDVTLAKGAVAEVSLPGDASENRYACSRISGPLVNGDPVPGGTLKKTGPGTLVIQRNGDSGSFCRVTLQVDEGKLHIGQSNKYPMFRDTAFRVTGSAADTWTDSAFLLIAGHCSVDVAEGKTLRFTRTVQGYGSPTAVLAKTGAGTFESQIQDGVIPVVEAGTLHARVCQKFAETIAVAGGARLKLGPEYNKYVTDGLIPASCKILLQSGGIYERAGSGAGTLTAEDGAVISQTGSVKADGSDCPAFTTVTAKGTLRIADLPADAAPGRAVLRLTKSTADADVAKRMVAERGFTVKPDTEKPEWYVLAEGDSVVITPPEGQEVPAGSALEQALKAAAAAEGVTTVTLVAGTGNGRPLDVDQMDAAAAVFAGAMTAEKQGDTLTATVSYSFAVTDIRIEADEAVLTVTAADAAGNPLKLAAGARVRLLSNGLPVGDPVPDGLSPDGTAVFRLKLGASAPNLCAEAYTE